MLPLNLSGDPATPLKLLFLGAHSDDIEIGCGGTVLRLLSERANVDVTWVVFSAAPQREQEARTSASLLLQQAARQNVKVLGFRDGFFPYEGLQLKESFETLKKEVEPDLIFTHHRDDRHQDHRTISDLTWNTWRRHLIVEYEIPKYDADLGTPNCFVPISEDLCARKARHICEVFRSESGKTWLTEQTFQAVLRLRGIECASPTGYAEAFHCRKFIVAP